MKVLAYHAQISQGSLKNGWKKNAWIAFMTQVSGAVKLGLEAN